MQRIEKDSEQCSGASRAREEPPSLRAELAAAVRWVNARRAELPAAVRAEIAVPVEGIAAEVASADAAGDRARGMDAIRAWRAYWAERFERGGAAA
jgi:hypothetical protein